MANKELEELGPQVGFTPKAGAFGEAAANVRELQKQGLLRTQEDRDWAQGLTEKAYRDTMLAQMQGFDVGPPEELPEYLKRFPDATNPDGTVNFSKT